MTLKFITL